jgi:hypothetical protein
VPPAPPAHALSPSSAPHLLADGLVAARVWEERQEGDWGRVIREGLGEESCLLSPSPVSARAWSWSSRVGEQPAKSESACGCGGALGAAAGGGGAQGAAAGGGDAQGAAAGGGGAQAAKGERALRGMVASRAEGTDGGQDSTKGTRRSKVGRRKRKVRRF